MPSIEETAKSGLKFWKSQAKRRDAVGEATYRALQLIHDGAGSAGRALRKLEEATMPPTRHADKRVPATRKSA